MAIEFKRARTGDDGAEDERRRQEAEQTREQFGIETLSSDEELIDDETFSAMHDRLAIPNRSGRSTVGGEPGGDSTDELLLEEIATVLPRQAGAGLVSPDAGAPPDAAAVAGLERRLLDAKDRDEVAAVALAIARYHAEAAALFVVNKGIAAGLRGSGGGLEDRIEGVMIPSNAPSGLAAPIESGRLVRSAAPFGPVDQRVLRAMGRDGVAHVAMLPVSIGERVVNLLYVDGGPAPLAETSLAALRVLCIGVGRVYERLILERKHGG
jgi:hypothetical protein